MKKRKKKKKKQEKLDDLFTDYFMKGHSLEEAIDLIKDTVKDEDVQKEMKELKEHLESIDYK